MSEDPLPRFKFWWGHHYGYQPRPFDQGGTYQIGLVLFPLPREQQERGMMVKARFAATLTIHGPLLTWFYKPSPFQGYYGVVPSSAWTGRDVPDRQLYRFRWPSIKFWKWS